MATKQAKRIQESFLNGAEKKALKWLAERQPSWVTSDLLTTVGFIGSVMMCAGYILSSVNINWLWFCSLGYVINWYGDSLDGTLARVRNQQRPIYGFYLDHTMDAVNEVLMFMGAGLSTLMHLPIAMFALVIYLLLTINVTINTHLKGEFKLTYAKFGPTELRLLMVIINTLFIFIKPLREFESAPISLCGTTFCLKAFDFFAIGVIVIITLMYITAVLKDLKEYDRIDPKPNKKQ